MTALQWSENLIARTLARRTFDRKHLVIVPSCSWPGNECDLLVVTPNLRVIDVEIKISRSDLKADAKKDKWFHVWDWEIDGPWYGSPEDRKRRPLDWPHRVWKHYYCVPRDIWDDSLIDSLPSPASGVLLMYEDKTSGDFRINVKSMAKPDRKAERIAPEDAVNIARMASMRMWDALEKLEERR